MKITGYYSLEDRLLTSDRQAITEPPYLQWLLEHSDGYHVCYHLDHFVACLCRLIKLDDWQIRKLVDDGRLKLDSYYINYIPGKFFSVKQGTSYNGPFAMLSDISKFIECTFTLDVEEGFRRAEQAKEIGTEIAEALVSLGLNPSSLVSPIRAWEKERMEELDLPTVEDMPDQVGEWSYEACKGNWVESFYRGHWEQAWDWDINSAYPYFASQLPDFCTDDWIKDYSAEVKADIGVYRCLVDMTSGFHPVLYKNSDDENYTPTGKYPKPDCLSLKMINYIDHMKLGKVKVMEGYYLSPEVRQRKPLEGTMNDLWREKNRENGIRREVVKRVMSGIYGKMLEVRLHGNPFGRYFNPIWAMEIETNTRIEDHRFCAQYGVVPLHVAVDGVLVDRELPCKSSTGMGKWRLASCCPALVIGSGQVAVKDKVGVGEFKMDYDWLMGHGVEEMIKLSPMTLPKSKNLNRLVDIGKLDMARKTVDLNSEVKRCYLSRVENWEDFVGRQEESLPWDIATVMKIGDERSEDY